MKRCVFVLLIALAGCIGTGPRIDANQLTEIQKGKSTMEDVLKHFGRPTSSVKDPNGEQILVYYHTEIRPNAATFIPFIGPLVGNVANSMHSVIFQFDARGILTNYHIVDATIHSNDKPVGIPANPPDDN